MTLKQAMLPGMPDPASSDPSAFVPLFDPKPVDELRYMTEVAAGPAPIVTVSIIERAQVYVLDTIRYSATAVSILRIAIRLILIYQSVQEKSPMLKTLKTVFRVLTFISVLVGGGGALAGLIPANIAIYVVGAILAAKEIVVVAGDLADDGKPNSSFDPTKDDTAVPAK